MAWKRSSVRSRPGPPISPLTSTAVRRPSHERSFDSAALRSGFRQQAPASLTPAKRLKFDPDQVHQSFNNLADPPRSAWPEISEPFYWTADWDCRVPKYEPPDLCGE